MNKRVASHVWTAGLTLALMAACASAKADEAVGPDSPTDALILDLSLGSITPDIEPDNYAHFRKMFLDHQAKAERVSRISRRLRVANAPLCDRTRLDAGLSIHSLDDYPEAVRPLALHFLPLEDEGFFIRNVVAGSPGDDAQLRPGEQIVSGWPLQDREPLIVRGPYGPQEIMLESDHACITPALVIASDRLNASTDGQEIKLSTALVDQVGDDAGLALIIAHEMSHALRGHTNEMSQWDIELEADSDALILMHNADYDVSATVTSWEAGIEIPRESQSLSATHPPVEIRLQNLQQRLHWINAQNDAVLDLP